MFKLTFVLTAVVLVALQGATARHVEVEDERSIADWINKASEAIKKLKTIITDAVHNAINKLSEIKDKIINTAKDIFESAKETIVNQVQKIKDQIEKIKEQAAAIGVDIKECLADSQSDLEDILHNTVANMLSCITTEVDHVKKLIADTLTDILGIGEAVTGFTSALKQCIVGSNKIQCMKNLISDIVSSITSIPAKITNTVNEIIKLVTGAEDRIKLCAVRNILEATKEATAIGMEVAKCAANKIKE